ncbi:DivIVA domain-containing protein [Xylanimonas sp. McL0601]|uniref:DivIVA domain-containing protein n=1 Tax=Xylanimonas sp. McL0601 TaxID=3414739 RepID=UPI003CFAB23B
MDLFPHGGSASGRPDGGVLLTAADIRARRFALTRFREGYVPADVDELLERVARGLDGTGPVPTPLEVLESRFAATKFKEGYDVEDVDDFLDRVVATLQLRLQGIGGTGASAPAAAAAAAGPAWGLRQTSHRLQLATAQALSADLLQVRTADGRLLGVVGLESSRDGVTLVVQ